MRKRGPLRLVREDDAEFQNPDPAEEGQHKPFSIRLSLAIWGFMAALAWGAVVLVAHFLR